MDDKSFLEAPPPYTAVPANPTNTNSNGLELNSLTSHLQHHVLSLPDRIRATQQARRAEQTLSDVSLLDYIVPVVEEFLADLGARHTPVPLATLTLVPGAAVPGNAVLSGLEDMKRRGEISRISRISINNAGKDSKSGAEFRSPQSTSEDQSWISGQEFTDWGRFGESNSLVDDSAEKAKTLWWHDEEMAHRLASYLQPKKEIAPVDVNSVVQAVVEHRIPQKKEKKGWGWGRRTSIQRTPEVPIPNPVEPDAAAARSREQEQKGAEMTVSAEEVAFRQENDFGILESVRGWGIIVAVKVRT